MGDRPSVGFVGLGTMGRGMARRVLAAELPLTVFDVNAAAVDELVAAGASAADSLETLGAAGRALMIAVVNEAQVREVVGTPGERGLLARARPGTVLLVHSTIHPQACRDLAARAAEVGVELLDAPMTGNPVAAAAGRLSVMVGGDPQALESVRGALAAFATMITHLGPVGAGQSAKIANNLAIAITMRAAREALALAAAYDIPAEAMLGLLASGGADSWVVRNWLTIGETAETYPGGYRGLSELTNKDLSLALELARTSGLELPTGSVVPELLDDAYAAALADFQAHRRADRPADRVQEATR
jgi:2-hydroxy-3-oxopropionate reductase